MPSRDIVNRESLRLRLQILPNIQPSPEVMELKKELEREFWLDRYPDRELDSDQLLEEVENEARLSPTSQSLSMLIHLKDLRRFGQGGDHVVYSNIYDASSMFYEGTRSQQQLQSRSLDSPNAQETGVIHAPSLSERNWSNEDRAAVGFAWQLGCLGLIALLAVYSP